MKRTIELSDDWLLTSAAPAAESSLLPAYRAGGPADEEWIPTAMPREVHETLLERGLIEDPARLGKSAECGWVAERDWVYRTSFRYDGDGTTAFLNFTGLDTLVDIYLNGTLVAHNNDMFVPLRVDVTGFLQEENELVLYFFSPHEFLRNVELPEAWKGRVRPNKMLRKPFNDFTDYLGPKPYLTPIGVYGAVFLETVDILEIDQVDVATELSTDLARAELGFIAATSGADAAARVRFVLRDPEGATVFETEVDVVDSIATASATLEDPQVWWPKGYGEHPLYEVETTVLVDGEPRDIESKRIGIRRLEMPTPFDFIINGRTVKLWGAQPAPLNGLSHRWDREKAFSLLQKLDDCNMNAVRLWGASERWESEFYEETDRRGILVWQEFFHDIGMYPDTEEYRALCRREAEFQVQRLKHHPSILMWCGGNECFMGGEYDFPGEKMIGREIFEDYTEVCARLDPTRYFHLSSPSGGDFANDPRGGDTHSYTNMWFVPGADFPVMVAEEIRASPPAVKSMVRYFEDSDPWPAEYTGLVTAESEYPWPDTWTERSSTEGWKKIPEIELFHDSNDLESGVYKFGAAHAYYMKRILENNRRGKPWWSPDGERINRGHFVCRWNDSWPIIYGSMLDYYGEPYQPYFAVKRAYVPVLLSIDVADFITVWIINDSADAVAGTLVVKLFDPATNTFTHELQRDVSVEPDESMLVTDLNEFRQFRRDRLLYAHVVDASGKIVARANEFVDIERHLKFPDSTITAAIEGDELVVSTDLFARCVEIGGRSADGDEFGWVFEDNYFDLFPGETKRIAISGVHASGTVTVKAHFASAATEVEFSAEQP